MPEKTCAGTVQEPKKEACGAEEILKGNLHENDPIAVIAEGDKLVFTQSTPAAGTEAETVSS